MEQYSIKMENFEGPLDLLINLIEKNKMDILDIKISIITDQYLEHLKMMQDMKQVTELDQGQELNETPDISNSSGKGYTEMGKVYKDSSGKLIMVED